ncbi:HPP family-domain-containing protein [Corynascus novoguineensis]|uniref:HPP family-domain-containing protein n=1 Tax=Corynascus novoguineensis TaxID=1126955 RepID=A0AAN7HHT4_9PEZI|nr:HPP family-domain-containing protein [Corynascus novoguineensis]
MDKYLNPFFPPSALPYLPASVAHFLGYRTHIPQRPLGNLAMIFWAVIGVFASLAIIGAVDKAIPAFQVRGAPVIIGSYGAAAVLDFYAIESPLAQPRNAILGQMVSALTGVAVCKLFALSPHFEAVRWLGASLACACATALMALTGTVHPPAGATALLAVLDPAVADLGWFLFVPLLLGCSLMLGVALLVNNIQRRFPFYWWSPSETGMYWRRRLEESEEKKRAREEESEEKRRRASLERRKQRDEESSGNSTSGDIESHSTRDLTRTVSSVVGGKEGEIIIRPGRVQIPEGLGLRNEEILFLETLSERL